MTMNHFPDADHLDHLSQIAAAARGLADSLDRYAHAALEAAAQEREETGPRCGLPFTNTSQDQAIYGQPCRRRAGHTGPHQAFIRTAPDHASSVNWWADDAPNA